MEQQTSTFCSRSQEYLRTKFRFVAYSIFVLNLFTEMGSRFGAPIAMLGGMVKKNCSDPDDTGTFCWSEGVKANVLGAFFYGYTFQIGVTVAARYLGFTNILRFWMLVSAVLIGCYPVIADISTDFLVATQVFRGLLSGIVLCNSMEFVRKWSHPKDSKYLISVKGVVVPIGVGSGQFLAGYLTKRFGWRYYFYVLGWAFLLNLILNILFVPDLPADSRFMVDEEKAMLGLKSDKNYSTITGKGESDQQSAHISWKDILSRRYVWAFCLYLLAFNFVYYNTLSVAPFYLSHVLRASSISISWLIFSFGMVIALSTIICSKLLHVIDERRWMSWVQCRMMFTLLPLVVQSVFLIVLPHLRNNAVVITALLLCATTLGTCFSGSIFTINYELDPINASITMSIFNSVGQCGGFLGPLIMAGVTDTDPLTPDYESVYRTKWSYFFYIASGFAVMGIISIISSYVVKPEEWVVYGGWTKLEEEEDDD